MKIEKSPPNVFFYISLSLSLWNLEIPWVLFGFLPVPFTLFFTLSMLGDMITGILP
jgi:hypothetical protein